MPGFELITEAEISEAADHKDWLDSVVARHDAAYALKDIPEWARNFRVKKLDRLPGWESLTPQQQGKVIMFFLASSPEEPRNVSSRSINSFSGCNSLRMRSNACWYRSSVMMPLCTSAARMTRRWVRMLYRNSNMSRFGVLVVAIAGESIKAELGWLGIGQDSA